MSTQSVMPRKNVMIGITHDKSGVPIIRESKVLKVGVGLPRGKAVDVYVDPDGLWNIRQGKSESGKLKFSTVAKVKTKAEAEAEFRKAYESADLCGYPRKVPYFVFTRPVVGKDGAEVYIPDFAATEAYSFADPQHPGAPTEVDVIFLEDDPFSGQFAYWSSSELRCSGDGENALRSVNMYADEKKVPEPFREAWKAAKDTGQRTFPIVDGCWTCNCPFAKEQEGGKPSPCKPSGDLKFQLIGSIRVGGTAFFHTSGYRSIVQIFSAIERIKSLTGGRIAGIPLKMVLRSYKTNHNGTAALQSGVSLEFRAQDMASVKKNLIEQAWQFRSAAGLPEPKRMIEAADDIQEQMESPMSAQALANEFYVDNDEEGDVTPSATNSPATQAASAAKVTEIGEKLAAAAPASVAAAPAPASPTNVTEMPAPKDTPPWKDRTEMAGKGGYFDRMKSAMPEADFTGILKAHAVMIGSLKPDEPKAIECYRALEAHAKSLRAPKTEVPKTETPQTEGSLF